MPNVFFQTYEKSQEHKVILHGRGTVPRFATCVTGHADILSFVTYQKSMHVCVCYRFIQQILNNLIRFNTAKKKKLFLFSSSNDINT